MKSKLISLASALLASGLAIAICAAGGARGQTLEIIALLTLTVSGSTAFVSACLAQRSKKNGDPA